jgi:acyl-homoserine-lactone acylase
MTDKSLVGSLLALLTLICAQAHAQSRECAAHASRVTITRDDWGIAHVTGRTDATEARFVSCGQRRMSWN